MRFFLLGVPIDVLPKTEVLQQVDGFLEGGSLSVITTPNPEMLVDAQRDPLFLRALQSADLALADGFGLVLGAALQGHRLRERFPGVDALKEITALAAGQNKTVCLLGAPAGVGERAAEVLRRENPGSTIVAVQGGEVRERDGKMVIADEAVQAIAAAQPAVLFVAFGHGKQERWIADHRDAFPSIRIMMGVGGAFDFLAGTTRRAPAVMRRLGLEWLWRLAMEPRRLPRIIKAVIVFPLLVIADRVKNKPL